MKEYRLAIIGAFGHVNYVLRSPALSRCRIVGMAPGVEEDKQELAALSRRCELHPDWPYYIDFRQMLQEAKPEIVVVNSIFAHNCTIAIACLEAGCHVLCEKPLATELQQLETLKRLAEKSGLHLKGLFGLRYENPFFTLQNAVHSGLIGDLILINGQKSYKMGNRHPMYSKRETYGGIIPWVAIHAIDWIAALTDRPVLQVQASQTRVCNGDNGDMESAALCIFNLEGGILASISADVLRPEGAGSHGDDRLRVVGSKGILEMAEGTVTLTDASGSRKLPLLSPGDLLTDFIDQVDTNPGGSVDGIYATKVALYARQAADRGIPIALR